MQKDWPFLVPWIQLGERQKYILGVAGVCWIVQAALFNMLWKWSNPSLLSGNNSAREWHLLNATVLAGFGAAADAAVLQLPGPGKPPGQEWAGQAGHSHWAWLPKAELTQLHHSYPQVASGVWDRTDQSGQRGNENINWAGVCSVLTCRQKQETWLCILCPVIQGDILSKWCLNMFLAKWVKQCLS